MFCDSFILLLSKFAQCVKNNCALKFTPAVVSRVVHFRNISFSI